MNDIQDLAAAVKSGDRAALPSVFLTLARTGDQLQGIKKGVLKLADIGRHSADLSTRNTLAPTGSHDERALEGTGLAELWDTVLKHSSLTDAGEFDARRRAQQVDWTWSMVRDTVLDRVLAA